MSAEVRNRNNQKSGWINVVVNPLESKDRGEPDQPEPRPGSTCPKCRQGKLDYDGMLNLACNQCGYSLAGCFT